MGGASWSFWSEEFAPGQSLLVRHVRRLEEPLTLLLCRPSVLPISTSLARHHLPHQPVSNPRHPVNPSPRHPRSRSLHPFPWFIHPSPLHVRTPPPPPTPEISLYLD